MPKRHIVLSENEIARIINGEEVTTKINGEDIVIRESYMKDPTVDMFNRQNRVINTASNTFKY